jgi:hypothetical protein
MNVVGQGALIRHPIRTLKTLGSTEGLKRMNKVYEGSAKGKKLIPKVKEYYKAIVGEKKGKK